MKRLLGASGLAALLLVIVVLNVAMVAAQGAGDPGPPATTTSGGSVERSVDVDKADGTRSWSWLGWPTMVGSIMFGNYWAIRRFSDQPIESSSSEIHLRQRGAIFRRESACSIIFWKAAVRGIEVDPGNWTGS